MRTIFFLIFLAGLAAGFGYPWYVTNFSGREIGTWQVYDRGGSFSPVTTKLSSADGPVRVLVDMTAGAEKDGAHPQPFRGHDVVVDAVANHHALVGADAEVFACAQEEARVGLVEAVHAAHLAVV